mmetsp:Transcript_18043/g.2945  ORF Transcript_18043/g.2945 Transcript_18043/m.2945 type:complete len:108 (+) Transcript_18043:862-1185(+)|eukprot:CAMPEP_0168315266 /NCGR_PEP_ID=MMETSP0210-20121227/10665_1 /TAXON_ID=40633 /ORGANISM="Condylostoma magnum, Strain COL2" /LENGTH=107 /DNA_ID=CAMNT_0008287443 /DNA_START=845 /DNA_END=1168 /DNA_ORIENTATION=-
MHISRFPKETELDVIKLYQAFNSTSEATGVDLRYVKKKVNIGDPYVPWLHENFAKRRVVAATLSARGVPYTKIVESETIFDRVERADLKVLERNVKFIAESLGRFIY